MDELENASAAAYDDVAENGPLAAPLASVWGWPWDRCGRVKSRHAQRVVGSLQHYLRTARQRPAPRTGPIANSNKCIFWRRQRLKKFRYGPEVLPGEVTEHNAAHKAAVKIISWQKIRESYGTLRTPNKEVATMQFMSREESIRTSWEHSMSSNTYSCSCPFVPQGDLGLYNKSDAFLNPWPGMGSGKSLMCVSRRVYSVCVCVFMHACQAQLHFTRDIAFGRTL